MSSTDEGGEQQKPHVLLCASGSVATVKVPEIALQLQEFAEVKVVMTRSADFFLKRTEEYNKEYWDKFIQSGIPVFRDEDEWKNWNHIGDEILHIQLKDWADCLLIAPTSANTLAKLANGLSDNLLTSVARAWSTSKPVFFAPAMNVDMWAHPFTAKHQQVLTNELLYSIILPVRKMLACGVEGMGGLAKVADIVRPIRCHLVGDDSPLSQT